MLQLKVEAGWIRSLLYLGWGGGGGSGEHKSLQGKHEVCNELELFISKEDWKKFI